MQGKWKVMGNRTAVFTQQWNRSEDARLLPSFLTKMQRGNPLTKQASHPLLCPGLCELLPNTSCCQSFGVV